MLPIIYKNMAFTLGGHLMKGSCVSFLHNLTFYPQWTQGQKHFTHPEPDRCNIAGLGSRV